MSGSRTQYHADHAVQQSTSVDINMWIEVRRHYAASTNSTRTGVPRPSAWDASHSATRQQPVPVDEIVALVNQHSSRDPWDGIGMVQAPPTTTANWYDPHQHQYQQQTYNYDSGSRWDTGPGNPSPGAEYIDSTQADHGSQGSEEQQESSDRVKDASSAGKHKSHSKSDTSRKHIPSRRS
ncbi:hypothetical protein G7Z17_g6272 [Cylindrodendrum hubeiense]|uniref:Uncharacterized protein n=1 Tax=Cylindrodendrum hubeiense TaxID=595255 RepID=A0A9P5LB05_9HYPO|nr:hypothetical protein G7Z17_g6272 [Cylindrodendrum hubeiense]